MLRMAMIVCLTVTLLLIPVASAQADIIQFREGGGIGYVDVTFDDTRLLRTSADNNYGDSTFVELVRLNAQTPNGYMLIGIVDLFDELPISASMITSATLRLTQSQTFTRDATVARVTTNWLLGSAGANESVATYNWVDPGAGPQVPWVDGSFIGSTSSNNALVDIPATADITEDGRTVATPGGTTGTATDFDVTDILKAIYSTGDNFGFAVFAATGGGNPQVRYYTSEFGTPEYRPTLIVEYVPEPASMGLMAIGGLVMLSRHRARAT